MKHVIDSKLRLLPSFQNVYRAQKRANERAPKFRTMFLESDITFDELALSLGKANVPGKFDHVCAFSGPLFAPRFTIEKESHCGISIKSFCDRTRWCPQISRIIWSPLFERCKRVEGQRALLWDHDGTQGSLSMETFAFLSYKALSYYLGFWAYLVCSTESFDEGLAHPSGSYTSWQYRL